MKIATLTLTAAGFLIGTVNAIAQSTVYFEDKFDGDALIASGRQPSCVGVHTLGLRGQDGVVVR